MWEHLIKSIDGQSWSEIDNIVNKLCQDGWEPYAIVYGSDYNVPSGKLQYHFKRWVVD